MEFEDDILGGGEGDGRLLSAGQGVKYALHGRLQNMIRYVINIARIANAVTITLYSRVTM